MNKDVSGIGPHGPVSEQFMRHHYGASGFVPAEGGMTTGAADLRYCGICWQGRTDGVRLHYCDLALGHEEDHRCHCGKTIKGSGKLAGKK